MKINTRKIVISAMLAALCCIATMIINIPSPLKGNFNLGDCVVLICGWILCPPYGFFAAGIGSMLADVLSPYIIYAPATFVIKGVMTLAAYYSYKVLYNDAGKLPARIIGAVIAELIMILGYFVFEGFLYEFGAAVVNIPVNAIQGTAGLILSVLIMGIFDRYGIADRFLEE